MENIRNQRENSVKSSNFQLDLKLKSTLDFAKNNNDKDYALYPPSGMSYKRNDV